MHSTSQEARLEACQQAALLLWPDQAALQAQAGMQGQEAAAAARALCSDTSSSDSRSAEQPSSGQLTGRAVRALLGMVVPGPHGGGRQELAEPAHDSQQAVAHAARQPLAPGRRLLLHGEAVGGTSSCSYAGLSWHGCVQMISALSELSIPHFTSAAIFAAAEAKNRSAFTVHLQQLLVSHVQFSSPGL